MEYTQDLIPDVKDLRLSVYLSRTECTGLLGKAHDYCTECKAARC